jgi:hypothetical protein
LDDGLHIATASRNKDDDFFHCGIVPLSRSKPKQKA